MRAVWPPIVGKIASGFSFLIIFSKTSKVIGSIKVLRSGKVKRAKLYYLRERKGKSARIIEKIEKKIGINVSEQTPESDIIKEDSSIVSKKNEPKKEDLKKEKLKTEKK